MACPTPTLGRLLCWLLLTCSILVTFVACEGAYEGEAPTQRHEITLLFSPDFIREGDEKVDIQLSVEVPHIFGRVQVTKIILEKELEMDVIGVVGDTDCKSPTTTKALPGVEILQFCAQIGSTANSPPGSYEVSVYLTIGEEAFVARGPFFVLRAQP